MGESMTKSWQELTGIVGNRSMTIERVRMADNGLVVEGSFELTPLARLAMDDQIFVAAFIQCHGSIKQMEKYYGVSYPTIKNRLNRIGSELELVHISPVVDRLEILRRLDRGEISVQQALEYMEKGDDNE